MAAPSFVSAGTQQESLTGLTVPWGSHRADDIGILVVQSSNEAVATPTGWTLIGNAGTGTAAAAGATSCYVFWKRAASGAEASVSVADTGDHQLGRIFVFRGCDTSSSVIDAFVTGTKTPASTSSSLTGPTTTVAQTMVVLAHTSSVDGTTTTNFGAYTNAGLIGLTERGDDAGNVGTGGALGLACGVKAAAGAVGNSTATITSGTEAWVSFALRPAVTDTTFFGDNTQNSPNGGSPANGDRCWVSPYVLSEAATLSTMYACFDSTGTAGGNAKLLIFADSAGEPSTLLASTAAISIPAGGGWLSAPISGSLSAGTYWLGVVFDSFQPVLGNEAATGPSNKRAEGLSYTTPTNWPGTAGTTPNFQVNVYVAYTTSTSPIDGDLAVTLGSLTSSGTGTSTVTGSLGSTLAALTLAAGDSPLPVDGDLAATFDALTVSATGTVVTPSTAFFGEQGTAGSGNWGTSIDRAMLDQATLIEDGTAKKLWIYLNPISIGSPTAHLKGLIFTDSSGNPGTLVTVGAPVSIPAGGGWVASTLSDVPLTAGAYWIGFVSDDGGGFGEIGSGANVTPDTRMYNGTYSYSSPPSTVPTADATYNPNLAVHVEYEPASAGGAVDGDLAATFSALTSTATGTSVVTGTASNTLGVLTSSATGTASVTGTVGQTLAALTGAGTGQALVKGTTSAVLGSLDLDSTATSPAQGQSSASLASATLSSTGTSSVTGTTAATLGSLVLVSTGGAASEVTGDLAQTLGVLTVISTGSSTIEGTLSATLAPVTSTGAGTLIVSGQAAETLASLVLQSIAKAVAKADLTATLGELTVVATGGAEFGSLTGTLDQTLGDLTGSATGTAPINAQGSPSFGPVMLAAQGGVLVQAWADLTLGSLTLSSGNFVASDEATRVIMPMDSRVVRVKAEARLVKVEAGVRIRTKVGVRTVTMDSDGSDVKIRK